MKNKKVITGLAVLILVSGLGLYFALHYKKKEIPLSSENKELTAPEKQTIEDKKYQPFSESIYIQNSEKNITNQDYSTARKVTEEGLQYYPNSEKLIMNYVAILTIENETDKAISYTDKLIHINPSNYVYWKLKAQIVRSKIKEYTEEQKQNVKNIYDQALVATKNNIEIISTYAVFAEDYLSKDKAIELWEMAKKVNPIGAQSYQVIIDRLKS